MHASSLVSACRIYLKYHLNVIIIPVIIVHYLPKWLSHTYIIIIGIFIFLKLFQIKFI